MAETPASMEETLELLPSPLSFLMRVMKDEKAKQKGNLGHLVIAVHAVFLHSGFVLSDAGESLLPDGWHSPSVTVSVRYTLPGLPSSSAAESNGSAVVLSFSVTDFDVSINGLLDQPDSRIYRVSFDISKLAGPLIKSMHGVSEKEEKEVLKLWRTVKNELSQPLLIEICFKNGLDVPYSLMSLPTELKRRILDFLPGVDLANIQCVCVEWKQLTSSDQLWKQKFEEEFGEQERDFGTWKEKYARRWMATRRIDVNSFREQLPRLQYLGGAQAIMPVIVGPSGVLQPWSSRNHWRSDFHRLVVRRGHAFGAWGGWFNW